MSDEAYETFEQSVKNGINGLEGLLAPILMDKSKEVKDQVEICLSILSHGIYHTVEFSHGWRDEDIVKLKKHLCSIIDKALKDQAEQKTDAE